MYGYGYRYNSGLVVGAGGGGGGFVNTYSLDFDGVDDYVNTGYISELNNVSTFTFSGWYKQTTLDQFNPLFESFVDANNWLGVYTYTDGNMYLQFAPGSVSNTSFGYFDYSTVVTANTWFNLVLVYDGTALTNADKLKCYVDGVQISLTFVRIIPSSTPSGINTFNICRSDNFSVNGLGNSDEIALWDSIVSIGDVWDGSGKPTDLSLLATPPIHWYRMGDNGSYKSPQFLLPSNENKDKVSNYSLDFDGVDDYVSVSDNSIGQTQNISYSIWVNLDVTTDQWLIGNQQSSNGGAGLAVKAGALIFQMGDGTNDSFFNSRVASFSTYAPINTWNHILATWDGTDSKIYINGVLRNTWSPTLPYTISGFSGTFNIGWRRVGFTQMTNGKLDELALFDSGVSIGDVWDGSGQPIDVSAVSGITNNWRMGEEATFSGGVWTVPDAVGSNDGTSNAMTIEDRVGNAPNSENNALSYNMDLVDRTTDVPT